MPNIKDIELTPLEQKSFNRIQSAKKNAVLLENFFDKGFKTYPAIKSIVQHYYANISDKRISNFWNMVGNDVELADVLENVLEKLRHE
jgi:hypothetical protein